MSAAVGESDKVVLDPNFSNRTPTSYPRLQALSCLGRAPARPWSCDARTLSTLTAGTQTSAAAYSEGSPAHHQWEAVGSLLALVGPYAKVQVYSSQLTIHVRGTYHNVYGGTFRSVTSTVPLVCTASGGSSSAEASSSSESSFAFRLRDDWTAGTVPVCRRCAAERKKASNSTWFDRMFLS